MDYEKFRLQVRDLATKAYKDLKEESKDYGELRQKCKKYCTGLLYRDKDMGNYVKGCFEKLFIHDLRDAQITHLSEFESVPLMIWQVFRLKKQVPLRDLILS